jgi:hypothetical protein
MSSSEVASVGVCLGLEVVEIGLESQMVQEVGNLGMSAKASRTNFI